MEMCTIPVTQVKILDLSDAENHSQVEEATNAALNDNPGWVIVGMGSGSVIIGKPL